MNSVIKLGLTFGTTVLLYFFYWFTKTVYRNKTSPLHDLQGPRDAGFFLGHVRLIRELSSPDNKALNGRWFQEYGSVFTISSFLGSRRLFTTDLKALNHVLMNSYQYQKPSLARQGLGRVLGNGDTHKHQRRIMNPAFGPAQIRELTEIFVDKSIKLRDLWSRHLGEGSTRVDVLSGLNRLTLDVIGAAGFNCELNALDEKPNELTEAFTTLFGPEQPITFPILLFLQSIFPNSVSIPTKRGQEVYKAKALMDSLGRRLIKESKEAMLKDKTSLNESSTRVRDLLSILIRANLSQDLPEHQRLSDEDVLAQIPTFLLAGHETTSTASAYALFSVAQYPDIQKKLRDELLQVPTQNPTMDELNELPYLDHVLKETLRLYNPVPNTVREAMEDDIIPISQPFTDKHGRMHDTIRVRKGDTVLIPILAINTLKSLWGEDAQEFRPDRWANLPHAVNEIPGLLNTLSFLGGPRACIGYRFSLVETKAILFTLIRSFEFKLAVPASEVVRTMTSVVQRPSLRQDAKAGSQLPLLLTPFVQEELVA